MKSTLTNLLAAALIYVLGAGSWIAINRVTSERCVLAPPAGGQAARTIVFRIILPPPGVTCENFSYRRKVAS